MTTPPGERRARALAWQSPLGHLWLLLAAVLLFGCRAKGAFRELDPDLNRMLEVPRYDDYEESNFFPDKMTMRKPPAGTVHYAAKTGSSAYLAGVDTGAFVARFPLPLSQQLVERGRSRYERTCTPCHGLDGYGNTVVTRHMRRPAPSLHQPRLRNLSPGKLYYVVSNGYGFMPGYSTHLDVDDRWSVVAYVKVLQRSQHARIASLPEPLRRRAERRLR